MMTTTTTMMMMMLAVIYTTVIDQYCHITWYPPLYCKLWNNDSTWFTYVALISFTSLNLLVLQEQYFQKNYIVQNIKKCVIIKIWLFLRPYVLTIVSRYLETFVKQFKSEIVFTIKNNHINSIIWKTALLITCSVVQTKCCLQKL